MPTNTEATLPPIINAQSCNSYGAKEITGDFRGPLPEKNRSGGPIDTRSYTDAYIPGFSSVYYPPFTGRLTSFVPDAGAARSMETEQNQRNLMSIRPTEFNEDVEFPEVINSDDSSD